MWGNNEVGSLNPINDLSTLCHSNDVFFHSDATQVLGKVPVDMKCTLVDALSFSAHKLNGPKGIGALYVRQKNYGLKPTFTSLLHGGEQEYGIRGGTLAVHNIVGFGKAAEIALRDLEATRKQLIHLEEALKKGLKAALPKIEFLGDPSSKLPGIISLIMPSKMFNNEFFIRKVSTELALSTGSACTAGKPSHVLIALDRKNQVRNVLRLSLSSTMKDNEVASIINILTN